MNALRRGVLTLALVGLAAGWLAGQNGPKSPDAAPESPPPPQQQPAVKVNGDTPVQLNFKNADINLVVQWLAKMTGKSIIPHKDVKCKLNIISSKDLPLRDALRLVYRALALEGYSAIENQKVILIVPEKLEPKVSAELLTDPTAALPGGRHKVIKVFDIRYGEVAKLKDALKPVLSEKAVLEVDERAHKIIVTDYVENVMLLGQLIELLDVAAEAETEIRVFTLVYMRADDLATLLTAVFTGKAPAKPSAPRKPTPKKPTAPTSTPVTILADKTSNRLIVNAAPEKIPEIEKLIRTLDTEKPQDVAVRLIPLRNVDAQELVSEVNKLYTKLKGETLKETIEISAVARSNALLVLSSEANFKAIEQLAQALDTEEGTDKTMRIFQLRYAEAEDVARQLEDLHDTRSSYGWYSRRSSREQYGQVKFVASRRQNEVIAIGPPGALDRIGEMIAKLDQPAGEENLTPRIYPLKFVAAKDIEEVLNGLFKKNERRNYWWDDSGMEDRDIGRLYGKVRVASEPYTNSLIITTNSTENFAAVERLIEQLDVRSEEREATLTLPLKYAKSISVANNLNILLAGPGSPARRAPARQPNQPAARGENGDGPTGFELGVEEAEESFFPWLGSQSERRGRGSTETRPVSDLVGKVRIVPDRRTNSLLITTAPYFFPQILKVVEQLDIPTAQVLIEAKILEIGREDVDRIGVRWSPDGSRVFDSADFNDSFLPSGSVDFTKVFAGTALENAMKTGILDTSARLDVLVQFLTKKTNTRVRAEPRLNVADNERGKLFVGSRIPFIKNQLTTTEGGQNVAFEYRDVGITLEVTPHINQKGEVALKVRVESSQIKPGETLFGGAIIDTRNYRTELTVVDGQTLVLGGIIQSKISDVVHKVPLLGDIPLLGYVFRKDDTEVRDVELMVFLRPTVTRSPDDVVRLMRNEREQTPQIQEYAPDVYQKTAGGPDSPRLGIVTWNVKPGNAKPENAKTQKD